VDGNPASLWTPSATAANWIIDLTTTLNVCGFGIGNHNLKAASSVAFSHSANGISWTALATITTFPTAHDMVYIVAGSSTSNRYWKVGISGAAANITIGTVSLIADSGYNSAGVLTHDGGLGILELANEVDLGPAYPIGRAAASNDAVLQTANGTPIRQVFASPVESFGISVPFMRYGSGNEGWKLANSYANRTSDNYTNPGWAKGVWLTDESYNTGIPVNLDAWYLIPSPGAGMEFPITHAGSRVTSRLVPLQTHPIGV